MLRDVRTGMVAAGLVAVLAGTSMSAVQDIEDILRGSRANDSIARRRASVRRLADANDQPSAIALARVVREASDASLREEAAKGLGRMTTKRAPGLLVDLIAHGTTRDARLELGKSILKFEDGVERLARRLREGNDDDLGRGLIVAALAEGEDDASRRALEVLVLSENHIERREALRALGSREDAGDMSRELAGMVLDMYDDVDSRVYALDLLMEASREMLAQHDELLEELASHRNASLANRAEYLRERRKWLDEMAERDEVRGTRYAKPGEDPEEPRLNMEPVDMVWSFETTYSHGNNGPARERIRKRVRAAQARGEDLRLGFVIYRDRLRDENQRRTSYKTKEFPLTHDIETALTWMDGLGGGGVDTQGLAVGPALHEGFARQNWRWAARRGFHLVGECDVGRPQYAQRVAKVHVQSDGTFLNIYARGRPRTSMREVAKAANTSVQGF